MTRRLSFILVSALLGSSACPTGEKYDRMPSVRITSPTTNPRYVNGTVQISAVIDPPLDLPIVLRRGDGVQLATLPASSTTFEWNTIGTPEGAHSVFAEVAFSDGAARSAPITIVVDRTKPKVVFTPAAGAVDVEFRSPIRATFSEPIVLSQPAGSSFPLSISGTPIASTALIDPTNSTVWVTIDDPSSVMLPARFSIALPPVITDRAGNPLVAPSAAWSWDAPAWFKAPPLAATSAPELAIDPKGQPFVVHTEGSTAQLLHVSRYDGTSWVEVGTIAGTLFQPRFESYSLTFDEAGSAVLAYVETNIGASIIGASIIKVRRWDGTAWQTSLPDLDWDGDPSITRPRFPTVRVTPAGDLVVAWRERVGTSSDEDLFVASWDGSKWDKSFGGAGFTVVNGHALTLDALGNPRLAWSTVGASGLTVWDGATKAVSPTLFEAGQPSVAIDLTGRPVFLSGKGPMFNISLLVQGVWQSGFGPVPTSVFAQSPRLVIAPDGAPVIAWIDNAGPTQVAVAKWLGTRWDDRIGLFYNGGNVSAEPPQVAVDANNSIWVAWRDNVKINVWKSNY